MRRRSIDHKPSTRPGSGRPAAATQEMLGRVVPISRGGPVTRKASGAGFRSVNESEKESI